jgi:thiamine biosynthesis protein ThiI
MKFSTIIIRYGEIGLKSKQTRKFFERKLMQNIKNVLKEFNAKYDNIKTEWGRLYVETTDKNVLPLLKLVFGIVSFSPAQVCNAEMKDISKLSTKIAKERINEKDTFAVRATRQGDHSFRSRDIGIQIGSNIQKITKAGVNLSDPTKEVFVEVRNKKAFVFVEKISGPCGIPQGIEGLAIGIFEKDRPFLAAAYLMSKRGCDIEAVTTEELDMERVRYWLGDFKIHTVDKTKDIYKEAEKIAKQKNAKAIFNSDILTKDTLDNLVDFAKISKKLTLPIFRPLIGFDEKKIKQLSSL